MLILLAIQVFPEVIVLSLGRKNSMISSSKRKSIVKEKEVVKHTKQMPLLRTNLPIMMNIKPLVPLLLQTWLLLFLLSILSLMSLNRKLEHLSSLIDSLSNVLPKLAQFVVHLHMHSVRSANSKPELSQLLFISVRQRELVKSSHWIGLCTTFLHYHMTL